MHRCKIRALESRLGPADDHPAVNAHFGLQREVEILTPADFAQEVLYSVAGPEFNAAVRRFLVDGGTVRP